MNSSSLVQIASSVPQVAARWSLSRHRIEHFGGAEDEATNELGDALNRVERGDIRARRRLGRGPDHVKLIETIKINLCVTSVSRMAWTYVISTHGRT